MKFTGVTLKNFQRHKKLAVQFSSGITTILGETDAGKSSILRALRWVCQNVPSGDEFIRKGAEGVKVFLGIESKDRFVMVMRSKAGRDNLYQVGTVGKDDVKDYRSFNTNVPDDIAKMLAVADINFQAQHDPPFWFSESAAEVSRRLNAVIDLSIIDEALSRVAATVRQANERKNVCEERLAGIRKELADLEPQRERIAQFKLLYEKHKQVEEAAESANRISSRLQLYTRHQQTLRDRSDQAVGLESVVAHAATARRLGRESDRLGELIASIQQESVIQEPPSFSAIREAYLSWRDLGQEIKKFKTLLQLVALTLEDSNRAEQAAEKAEAEFYKKIKGERCPICQRVMS